MAVDPTPIDQGSKAVLRHWRETAPDDRLAHLVRDATRGLMRALQMRLAEHSVSTGHWTFLRILWIEDGLTQRDLSERAGLTEPTTFSALQAMEKLGYVARKQQSDSRKKIYVFLTPRGRALRDTLTPIAEEVNTVAVAGVPEATIAAGRELLLAMIDNLTKDEAIQSDRAVRMPSTRRLSHLIAKARKGRSPGGAMQATPVEPPQ